MEHPWKFYGQLEKTQAFNGKIKSSWWLSHLPLCKNDGVSSSVGIMKFPIDLRNQRRVLVISPKRARLVFWRIKTKIDPVSISIIGSITMIVGLYITSKSKLVYKLCIYNKKKIYTVYIHEIFMKKALKSNLNPHEK